VNRLAAESSLYLRQHGDNPVDWYPWGEDAFQKARAEDRPVLLSIGYSSCHWCHVMAHESFEDEATASVMNDLFVNVKVDREERPDVDALYMQATLALHGHGGWPMTVFLTPERKPFYAGTYFPPQPRGGLPGFVDLCRAVAEAYSERRADVVSQADQVIARLDEVSSQAPVDSDIDPRAVDDAMVGLARQHDPANGGFGSAPKFPPSLTLEFLLRRAWADPDSPHAREIAELTLARMAAGGIYDQLGGGFHRYAVDAIWLVPHFEKMLYDNALLARAYALADRVTGNAAHRRVATETLDYLLREMRRDDGAFAAAQDADSPGGEGAYFVWTPADLARVLSPEEAAAAALRFGVSDQGNFEGGASILHLALPLDEVSRRVGEEAGPLLASARRKLLEERATRAAPARDDKAITSWNAMAVAAFADAGLFFDRADYLDVARHTAAFLLDNLIVDGRLHRVHDRQRARHLGQLDDHADLCHALLVLYEATFEPRWLSAARDIASAIIDLFAEDGGFRYVGRDGEQLVAQTRDLEDNPTPAGNSQAAWAFLRLARLTGESELEDRALSALRLVSDSVGTFPHAFGTALTALDFVLSKPREVAVVGDPVDPRFVELVATARAHVGPAAVIAAAASGDTAAAAAAPLLADRPLVDDSPTAYICRDFACELPLTSPELLEELLTRPSR
jgi:uncharacterized protein YyaL (SSP411 family)